MTDKITDFPIVSCPVRLPDGFEYRSNGSLWAIWAPKHNRHIDADFRPSSSALRVMLRTLKQSIALYPNGVTAA